jgi:hypothetical protein
MTSRVSFSFILAQKCLTNLELHRTVLKNVNNGLNTNIYSYLETSGGQSSIYIEMLFIFNTVVN